MAEEARGRRWWSRGVARIRDGGAGGGGRGEEPLVELATGIRWWSSQRRRARGWGPSSAMVARTTGGPEGRWPRPGSTTVEQGEVAAVGIRWWSSWRWRARGWGPSSRREAEGFARGEGHRRGGRGGGGVGEFSCVNGRGTGKRKRKIEPVCFIISGRWVIFCSKSK